ncbi:nucleoside phosphorylase [Leeuwenhoekiella sp. W20_SRS_FM14]|uniref:nucleoside phosphorylase n=1 Tax=Leeuwenhoekiella sp. W20_SRS_FM14 TaxID=3240270 RepID=UPI003F95189E
MQLPHSELILNADGSIYHLNLLPGEIADTIITVGDPDRVETVTQFFDSIELTRHKREFKTQTGYFKDKRITVISTGIGTDNIDIVLNELDALVNIDLKTRQIKEKHTALNIIRLGTSGAIQKHIPVDSILISEKALGFDGLIHYYDSANLRDRDIEDAFVTHTSWSSEKSKPYCVNGSKTLINHFSNPKIFKGITATNIGFYGPQGRTLRLALVDSELNSKIENFEFKTETIANLEMETSGIYALSALLGHRAISINAIMANRIMGTFSENGTNTIEAMISSALERIAVL